MPARTDEDKVSTASGQLVRKALARKPALLLRITKVINAPATADMTATMGTAKITNTSAPMTAALITVAE
jgi:hypothetical protein